MGWLFYHKPVGEKAVDSVRETAFGREWAEKNVVASSATREAVFFVIEMKDPESKVYVPDADGTVRTLAVIMIKSAPKAYYNFGYKDLTETMGPYGCEAPLSILAQCSPLREMPADEPEFSSLRSATNYRARSKAVAEAKAKKRSLKPGDVVVLPEPISFGGDPQQRFTVELARVRGRSAKKSTVFRAESGMLCSLRASDLTDAKIERRA